ncbi:MAG: response regulator [Aliidongia sp.]
MPEQFAISIIDDDESVREAILGLMQSHGYNAEAFESGASFLGSMRRHQTDCLIADFQMPGMTGLELHGRLAASDKPIPTILITARHDEALRAQALRAPACCAT